MWATVNVCDTAKQPDAIGTPGVDARHTQGCAALDALPVQYRTADGRWDDVEDADSGWRNVGTAKGAPVEYGWSFTFAKRSTPVTLRGVVKFRWRRATRSRPAGGRDRGRPRLQGGRRPGGLLRRDLRARN